jgi:hypothetical protein
LNREFLVTLVQAQLSAMAGCLGFVDEYPGFQRRLSRQAGLIQLGLIKAGLGL